MSNLPTDTSVPTGRAGFAQIQQPQYSDLVAAIRDAESRLATLEAFVTALQAGTATASSYAAYQSLIAGLTP